MESEKKKKNEKFITWVDTNFSSCMEFARMADISNGSFYPVYMGRRAVSKKMKKKIEFAFFKKYTLEEMGLD